MKLLFGLILCFGYVNCKTFPECNGKQSQTFVVANNNCRSFIYCNGENSFEDVCSVGLAFNPVELICDRKENVYCAEDIEMNNNVLPEKSSSSIFSKKRADNSRPHPPAAKPSRATPQNSPMKSTPMKEANSNRPGPTRKSSTFTANNNSPTKLTSLLLSTTRKNSPTKSISTSRRPSSTKTSSSPSIRTKSPIYIPTPPGPQNNPIDNQATKKKPVLTTLPKEKEPTTWLPTESTLYDDDDDDDVDDDDSTTKSQPKTKSPSSTKRTTKSHSKTKAPSSTTRTTTELITDETEFLTDSTTFANEINADSIEQQCIKQSVGSFAYPDDCHYYYRCSKGVLRKQECPKGLSWDAKSKMCTTKGCFK